MSYPRPMSGLQRKQMNETRANGSHAGCSDTLCLSNHTFERQWKRELQKTQCRANKIESNGFHFGKATNPISKRRRNHSQLPHPNHLDQYPLVAATLSKKTQLLYKEAFQKFWAWERSNRQSQEVLDECLSNYIHDQYFQDNSAKNRQQVVYLLSVLQLCRPSLRSKLGFSRKALSGWCKIKPPVSAIPLTSKFMLAFAQFFVSQNCAIGDVAPCVQWGCYMRASEVLALCISDIILADDVRATHAGDNVVGINIENSKTGPMQFRPLRDKAIIAFLRSYIKDSPPTSNAKLFDIQYNTYNDLFKRAANYFGLDTTRSTTHLAPIGGALADYLAGQSAKTIALTGRWKSFSFLQNYLTNGRAAVTSMKVSQHTQHRISGYSEEFSRTLYVLPKGLIK